MPILDRFLGLISALAYALQRSKIGFLRLHVGAMLLCLAGAAYVAYHGWQEGFTLGRGALVALYLMFIALLLWADMRRYVIFRCRPASGSEAVPDLSAEEKLFLRGSGFFEVSDMRRYFVEVPVVFWTTQLAEHILAAKVRAFNIFGLAGVPCEERGWWYAFIESRRVIEVVPGELCFGFRVRPAVRVLSRAKKGREVVYLSCSGAEQLAVLLKELQAKAGAACRSLP